MLSNHQALKIKKGYLYEDFKYFHLKDHKRMEFELHYHDFNKIIVFISGKVTYLIEGKAYKLNPWDVLFINSNAVHKPIISSETPYERIVIWINENFLKMHNTPNSNLLTCFNLSSKYKMNLLRLDPEALSIIKYNISALQSAALDNDFGSHILKNSIFIQTMVYLNRFFIRNDINRKDIDIEYDERIENILGYINKNLSKDLSVNTLSNKFFMSKYHLMHKFKNQTGYTVHSYIQQKRLINAASLIKSGVQVSDACIKCGFYDYSNFVRAFKKEFGLPPKKYYKTVLSIENSYSKNIHK